jgi:beta-mannosidase
MSYKMKQELNDNWMVFVIDDNKLQGTITSINNVQDYDVPVIPAQVPGNFELDYVKAGLLDDLFYADNILKLQDFENSHVFYSLKFQWNKENDDAVLLFEGIDTVADIYLNGMQIGAADNMFIPHEFQVHGLYRGENELLVHIKPVCLEARKYNFALSDWGIKYNYESLVIRKAAHMFGWDITPRAVSAGLWKPVYLIQKKQERIENVFLWVSKLDGEDYLEASARFNVFIGNQAVKHFSIKLEGTCGESHFETQERLWFISGKLNFNIEKPKLWWPRDYGDPNLYDVKVTLFKDEIEVDSITIKQGFRTVEVIHDDYIDENDNGEFFFQINKKKIFIKGTNWVPADVFHSNDMKRIPQILELVKDIGCNAMRCWGGNVYENEYFYQWCDENGIIIWQDFMMACAVYPQNESMKNKLHIEATTIVKLLRHHACICLWAGDNECDQNYAWMSKKNPTENQLTRKLLPEVVNSENPTTPYLPSSPYISNAAFLAGKEYDTPEQHLWGPRDYFKSHFYHDANATFASEMGYHGCPSPESVKKFISEGKLWPPQDNDEWNIHAASPDVKDSPYLYRIPLMTSQIANLFRQLPSNLEEYAYMSQISQAEAVKFFIESFRCRKWRRTGIIWWNIMDNWPQFSDAVVDYYFCKKLAYYYIKRSQNNVCLMMNDYVGELILYGVNDNQEDKSIRYTVTDIDTDLVICSGETILIADSSTKLCSIAEDGVRHFYSINWTCDGEKEFNHYLQGEPPFDYEWYSNCMKKIGLDEFEGFKLS